MPLIKERFRRYRTDDKESDIFTIRLSDKEKVWFEPAQKFINQPKKSTALKQLAEIGSLIVLQDHKISKIIDVVKGNSYRNSKLGLQDLNYKVQEKDEIVTPNDKDL